MAQPSYRPPMGEIVKVKSLRFKSFYNYGTS